MKKVTIILALLALAVFSCQKDPVGKTATVDLAGQWQIVYNCVDANGDFIDVWDDPSMALTFNTAANDADSIWFSDLGGLFSIQVKIPCNLADLTFGSDVAGVNIDETGTAFKNGYIGLGTTIKNGKILKGAATTPSGMPADSIYCEIFIENDAYAAAYGYDHYTAEGFRYTGFAADEP